MGEDLDIVVGVQVDTDHNKLQSQLDSIHPRPNIKAGIVVDPTEGKSVAKQVGEISTPKVNVHIRPSINQIEFEGAIKANIRRIKNMPKVHVRAELEPQSLADIRSTLKNLVNEVMQSMPALNLGELLGGRDGVQGIQEQANQVEKAVNQVTRTLRGLDPARFDISPQRETVKEQLREFGLPEKDVAAIVKQIESGGFKIAQARVRFAQQIVKGDDGKQALTTEELLQSISIAGTTADGVSAVRTLTRNALTDKTGEFTMSTQLGMTLDEQGKTIKAGNKAKQQAKKIADLMADLAELEAQAFNRRQPIKGANATTLRSSIQAIRDNLEGNLQDGINVDKAKADIAALKTTVQNMKAAQKAVNELGDISVAEKVKRMQSAVDTQRQTAGQFTSALNADGLVAEAQKVQNAFEIMDQAFSTARNAGDNATSSQWDMYTKAAKDYQEAVAQATNAQKRFAAQQQAISKATSLKQSLIDANMATEADALQQAMTRVADAARQLQTSTNPVDLQEYANAMKGLTDATQQYNDALAQNKKQQSLQDKLDKQMQTVAKIRNEWSKAMANQKNADWLSRIVSDMQAAAAASNKIGFDKATRQLQIFQATMKATGQATETFSAKMKRLVSEFSQWFSVSQLVMGAIQTFKSMISTNTEINSSMTELKKVTDETAASYDRFSDRAVERAKDLKTAITDVVDATSGWSRVGYDMSQAEELGKWSIIYANVGDDIASVDDATKSLISTLKGFGNEGNTTVEQAERIVDIFNKLGNNTAISSGQLGESLQHSAAALSEANNTLAESAALTVGAYDVLQNAAEVGNMWKTVSMRIRGAKVELEAAGEDTEGMVDSTSKLREQIKAMTGFDIMASANEFKSTYDIIVGIGEVWSDLADIEQASLLELLAGKNRGNALAAALNNVESIKEAYQLAADSAGSATAEYGVFEESVAAHAKRMEASMQAFSQSALSTDLIKTGYDAFSGILDGLTEITDLLGSIPSLATAAATAFTLFTGKGRSIVIYAPSGLNTLAA